MSRASTGSAASEVTHAPVLTINGQQVADIYHCNSVDVDPEADLAAADVLVSVRHTSGTYRIERPTGGVRWKLGGNIATGPDTAKRLLTVGDLKLGPAFQHDARFRPDGRISLFDNQSNHSFSQGDPRGIEYDVNDELATATKVYEYSASDGLDSPGMGSLRRYANGTDNVIGWGFKRGSGFAEVDADGKLLASLTFPKGDAAYRVVKEPPSALDAGLLRRTAGLPREGAASKVGVHRSNFWLLRNSATEGIADIGYAYADPSDHPLMGDWDGNGTKTPGIFRAGTWCLRNSNTTGVGEVCFGYGDPSDFPVVGDWDGNGTDTPGIFRGGTWCLRNTNTTGVGDSCLGYGDPGDFPVAGDWDGNATDTPAIVRPSPSGSVWALRNSNTTGVGDVVFSYGAGPGEFPLAGDWDGDGRDSAGLFNVYTGRWDLRNATTTGGADASFFYGDPGDWPIPWR